MSLFKEVQAELFEFIGLKNKAKKSLEPEKKAPPKASFDSFEGLPWPVEIVRKAHRRSFSLSVTQKAHLKVFCNIGMSEQEILSALQNYADWIEEGMLEAKKRHQKFPKREWKNGEVFYYQGAPYQMLLSPSGVKKPHIKFMTQSFEYFYPRTWLELEEKELQNKLKTYFLKAFGLRSKEILNQVFNEASEATQLKSRKLSFRNQKSRWGSCSSKGDISLNWKLACFRKEIQYYVIVHELCHLVHQNHSQEFWSLVERFCPDRKALSKELNAKAFHVDPFSSKSELYENNPALIQ